MRIPCGLLLAFCSVGSTSVIAAEPSPDPAAAIEQSFDYDAVVQSSEAKSGSNDAMVPDATTLTHEFRMQQERNKLIFSGILGLTALLGHLAALFALSRTKQNALNGGANVVAATGLIYIVFGTIMLVVIANTEAQLTAAIGILGAVAGYLFGRIRHDDGAGPAQVTGSSGKTEG